MVIAVTGVEDYTVSFMYALLYSSLATSCRDKAQLLSNYCTTHRCWNECKWVAATRPKRLPLIKQWDKSTDA